MSFVEKMFFRCLAGFLSILITPASLACNSVSENPPDISSLSIVANSLNVTQNDSQRSIVTLGTIKNASQGCFQDISIEVTYYDPQGVHIDTVVQQAYDLIIPAAGEASFRVFDVAASAKETYASQKVRILNAEPRFSTQKPPRKLTDSISHWFLNWIPMWIMILLWVFFMRRLNSKDSPKGRSAAALEKQIEHLEKIASAIERHNSK